MAGAPGLRSLASRVARAVSAAADQELAHENAIAAAS
jgi:hypothetical protein